MKKVFIFGESGRMGQEVKKIAETQDGLQYLGAFKRNQPIETMGEKPDILIDFSLPAALPNLIDFVKKNPCAVVSGTTGFNDQEFEQLKTLGDHAPVFWSANMSFGVYLMCRLTEMLARYDQFYDFKIEETHHIHKKDKPSGTALIIKEAAEKSTPKIETVDSIREGEVFGIHRFMATSKNESLEIKHEAFNRSIWAQGAVDISLWLSEKPKGFYSMADFFKTFEN